MLAHALSAALGIWLMVAPAVLGYAGAATNSDHIVGPLVVSFGLIALWPVTRGARWANVALAGWLLAAPLILQFPSRAVVNSIATGLLIGACSLVRGRMRRTFGGGWSSLFGRRAQ